MTEETSNLLIEDVDPAIIPDKFKNPESGALRLEALVNSYAALERKMSSAPSVPKTPDEYCIKCDHGLFEADADVNDRLYRSGFTQEQAQVVYDLAAEKMLPMMKELVHDFAAERELEKLVSHFGGQEQWRMVSKQLLSFGKKNLPSDVLENLASSYEGVLALHRMMKTEEPSLKRADTPVNHVQDADLQSMMRDPRYWKDKDPAYIAKVTEGFKQLYGE